ncbi:Protein YLS3 [Senna tora]|uniref:Protein YLS3 n=1 Tax=Senna tora TaxID=362788 RepID=A0A834X276_9FABA|nr:Protein YLS3 [Senna tora]
MTGRGKVEGESGIEGDAEVGVVAVFDEDAEALHALLHHLFETTTAIDGGSFGLTTNVWKARSQPYQLVRALFSVFRQIRRRQITKHNKHHAASQQSYIHGAFRSHIQSISPYSIQVNYYESKEVRRGNNILS